MTTTFTGEVRIPGSIENGLPSTITLDAQTLILTAGGTELGRWNRSELQLRREPDGTFHLTLGREIVLFNPDSPLEFAILSGMPGAGTVPAPAAAETPAPEPDAPAPAAAAPATPQPVATPPVAPQPAAAPSAPEPATVEPNSTPAAAAPVPSLPDAVTPTAPVPAATTPPGPPVVPPLTPPPGAPPTPATTQPSAVPAAQPASPQADPVPVAAEPSGLPPASPAAAAAVAAAASVQAPPTHPEPVEIRLETDEDAPPNVAPPAPAAVPPSVEPAGPAAAPRASDFWDGFHAEEQEAGVQPAAAPTGAMAAAVDETPAEIRLEHPDDGAEQPSVGGYGSGLFTDEEAPRPPAFGGTDDGDGKDRAGSFSDDQNGEAGEGAEGEDRGWSYDDPKPEEKEKEEGPDEPVFRSPNADREDLVEKSSRLKDVAAWRPSMPSFSFGGSGLGMRARDAISVLDSILEENGTEDIPKSFLIGLGALALVLTLLVILALVF